MGSSHSYILILDLYVSKENGLHFSDLHAHLSQEKMSQSVSAFHEFIHSFSICIRSQRVLLFDVMLSLHILSIFKTIFPGESLFFFPD